MLLCHVKAEDGGREGGATALTTPHRLGDEDADGGGAGAGWEQEQE